MDSSREGKRIRAWKGRSTKGCRTCRSRGKKCGEQTPSCWNCLKGGRVCDYQANNASYSTEVSPPISFAVPAAITSYSLGSLEKETFYKFVHHQSYLLGSFYDIGFWAKVVPCVAQDSDQILNATLAVATLYEIPTTGTIAVSTNIRRRYQNAIEWYDQSLTTLQVGLPNQSDISLLLISTILYLFVELRQIKYQNLVIKSKNLTSLTTTTFRLLYNLGNAIWSNDNSILLASLAMLIDVSIHLVDSTLIEREHRLFAIKLAMMLAAESGPSAALYILRIELASIVYDLHDLVKKDSLDETFLENEFSISTRIIRWQHALAQYRTTANPQQSVQLALDRLEFLGLMCQVRREFLQGMDKDWEMIQIALTQTLDLLDNATRFLQRGTNSIPDFTLETGFVIACTVIAWHWRDRYVFNRIARILKALPSNAFAMSNFLDRALVYIETLVNTEYHQATDEELFLFGSKPKSLLMWQQQRCADHLASLSREGAD